MYISVSEASAIFNVKSMNIYSAIKKGELSAIKINGLIRVEVSLNILNLYSFENSVKTKRDITPLHADTFEYAQV